MSSSGDSTDPLWWLVDVLVDEVAVETVSDLLWSLGVAAVEEIAEGDGVVLRTSTSLDPVTLTSLAGVRGVRRTGIPRSVADTWRETAHPSPVADGVAIVPAWRAEEWPESDSVLVEPGDAFGAGNHATTLLAARLLMRHASRGGTVFDLGCGTGVLALVAARHLRCRATVWDVAPGCRGIVEANVGLNGLPSDAVRWVSPAEAGEHDSVVANILAPVLLAERPTITTLCADGGVVILSGVRSEQAPGLVSAYGLPVLEQLDEDGWTAIALRMTADARP